jgi:hypothetical protein
MSDDTPTAPTVIVTMQQAYDLTLRLNIRPAREMESRDRRGFGQRRPERSPLPAATRQWLLDADERVFAWLASDESNQHAFLADPTAALHEAGVPLEREHLNAVNRLRRSIGRSQTIVPGLQLRSVRSTVQTADDTDRPDRTRDDRTVRG